VPTDWVPEAPSDDEPHAAPCQAINDATASRAPRAIEDGRTMPKG
jgi:hypothetical protein